ncbi:MAG: hypothetical protein V4655_14005 [Bdellovibrionota bacterium]|nr:MAG: hypothetical protein EOP10_09755 [Pseudomonadota bacterium]
MKRALLLSALSLSTFVSGTSHAQMITTEERFQDLFVTAGYGAAFGAAFGAALLSFQPKPEKNLKYVAIGASVGFITGSLMGTYMIFTPVVANFDDAQTYALDSSEKADLRISPIFDPSKGNQFAGVTGQWTMLRF